MSWLRTRKRTLDIVCETEEAASVSEKQIHNIGSGAYNHLPGDTAFEKNARNGSPNKSNLNKKLNEVNSDISPAYLTGVIEVASPDDVTLINVAPYDDVNLGLSSLTLDDKAFHSEGPISRSPTDINNLDAYNNNNQISGNGTFDINFAATKNRLTSSSFDLYTDISEDEEKDMKIMLKSCLARPRYSLDSQMPIMSTTKPDKIQSLPELKEVGPRQRRSISWADDLETVHEIEKTKGRRLSLSALFRKF